MLASRRKQPTEKIWEHPTTQTGKPQRLLKLLRRANRSDQHPLAGRRLILWALRPVTLPYLLPLVTLWAGSAFWNSPAIAARIMAIAGGSGQQAMALNTSFTYLGVALGAILGGVALNTLGVAFLSPTSLAIGILALIVLRVSR